MALLVSIALCCEQGFSCNNTSPGFVLHFVQSYSPRTSLPVLVITSSFAKLLLRHILCCGSVWTAFTPSYILYSIYILYVVVVCRQLYHHQTMLHRIMVHPWYWKFLIWTGWAGLMAQTVREHCGCSGTEAVRIFVVQISKGKISGHLDVIKTSH